MVPMIPSPRASSPSLRSNASLVRAGHSPSPSPVPSGPPRPVSTNPFGPALSSPPPAQLHQVQNGTVTSTGTGQTGITTSSSVTTHTSVVMDPVTGQVMRLPNVPWTGGLGFGDYNMGGGIGMGGEYGDANSSLGGSWGSPSHLRALREGMGMGDQSAGSHT